MSALRQIEAKAAAPAPAPAPVVQSAGAPSLTASPQTTSTPNWVRSVNSRRHTSFPSTPNPGPNPPVPVVQGTLGCVTLAGAPTVPRLPCRAPFRTGGIAVDTREILPYAFGRQTGGWPAPSNQIMKRLNLLCLIVALLAANSAAQTATGKRVLVYTRQTVTPASSYIHDNTQSSVEAIRKMGAENGFAVDASEDPNVFTAANLKRYQRPDLLQHPQRGIPDRRPARGVPETTSKAAAASWVCMPPPPPSASGRSSSPRSAGSSCGTRPFRNSWSRFRMPRTPRPGACPPPSSGRTNATSTTSLNPDLHPLLVADPSKLDDPERGKYPNSLIDGMVPLAWTITTGGRRVFYTALGHKKETYSNPLLVRHILGGVLWAMGEAKSGSAVAGGFMERPISFTLNGQATRITVDDDRMLLWVLRSDLGLTGTKFGCGEGLCGACTVIVDNQAVRSCSTPVKDVAGKQVLTIEGLDRDGRLHPIQEAFAKHHAFQCGFCTPGMILSAYALLAREDAAFARGDREPHGRQSLPLRIAPARAGGHRRGRGRHERGRSMKPGSNRNPSRRGFLALGGTGLFVFFAAEPCARVSAAGESGRILPTGTPICASAPTAGSPASPAKWNSAREPRRLWRKCWPRSWTWPSIRWTW